VFAESPRVEEFAQIFENCCNERLLDYDRRIVDYLLREWYSRRQIPLRGCHPRDLIEQALSMADYRGDPHELTPSLMDAACASYFVADDEPAQLTGPLETA